MDSESYPLGKRIAVFGKGGKTTLARALADRFEFEFVELDAIRHMAGWVERPDDDFREVVTASLDGAQRGWVTDGNYLTVRRLIFDRVETVIVLALPWKIMLWRTFKRSLRRSYKREELWNGNREKFWLTFFTRQSVVYDLWWRRNHFRNFAKEISSGAPEGIDMYIIRSPKSLEELYEKYGLQRR
ncbi:MAG: adenylate kinase [Dehalococcoidia bacterium]|nr:adenylate kinase [Dehalococcoidia bacterium]